MSLIVIHQQGGNKKNDQRCLIANKQVDGGSMTDISHCAALFRDKGHFFNESIYRAKFA